jgi:hypothetical protein
VFSARHNTVISSHPHLDSTRIGAPVAPVSLLLVTLVFWQEEKERCPRLSLHDLYSANCGLDYPVAQARLP